MSKLITNLSELQLYVNLLEDLNGKKKYTNYELLKKDLLIEFSVNVTIEQIRLLYEPTVEEEIRDREILLRNVS
ncbi:MAG: hypothetical protein E6R13_02435 [Spirochaetes bacterium]|nr:MAG: hypothetical protein E6R13_02435 [Spirochaetota bacterium]